MTRQEEITQTAKNKYPYIKGLPQNASYQAVFIEAAEWADKTMIKKAKAYVKNCFIGPFGEGLANNIADEFEKYLEE